MTDDNKAGVDVEAQLQRALWALSEMRGGLSPRAKQSLKEGAYWVRLSRMAALILLDEAPEWNAALPDEDPSLLTEAGNTLPLLHPTKKER